MKSFDDIKRKVEKAMNAPKIKRAVSFKHSPAPWRQGDPGIILDANGGEVVSDEYHGTMIAFGCGDVGTADQSLCVNSPEMFHLLKKARYCLNKYSQSSEAHRIAKEISKLLDKIVTKQGIEDYKLW